MSGESKVTNLYSGASGHIHTYYLYGIEEPTKYADLLNTITNASENDTVVIRINSEGGQLESAMQIRNALLSASCNTICSIDHLCASAATYIFFAAGEMFVSPDSILMIHNISYMHFGKLGELDSTLSHYKKWVKQFYRRIYGGFLTEKELQGVFTNQDLYFNDRQIVKRLARMVRKRPGYSKEQLVPLD